MDDAEKNWKRILEEEADAYMLDFIDQRYGLVARGPDIATFSTATERLAGDVAISKLGFRRIGALSEESDRLLREALPAFCDILSGRDRLIVNDCVWATHFEDDRPMTGHWETSSPANNRILDLIFESFAKRTKAVFLGIDRNRLRAARNHCWNEAAFHYSDETEAWIASRIVDAVNETQKA